jgi:hypothetical protein
MGSELVNDGTSFATEQAYDKESDAENDRRRHGPRPVR